MLEWFRRQGVESGPGWTAMDMMEWFIKCPKDRIHYWNSINKVPCWESALWFDEQDPTLQSLVQLARERLHEELVQDRHKDLVCVITPERAQWLWSSGFEVVRVEVPDHVWELMSAAERRVSDPPNYNCVVGSWKMAGLRFADRLVQPLRKAAPYLGALLAVVGMDAMDGSLDGSIAMLGVMQPWL